jgi:uncharacterized protein (DUF4213/DUF364 family)
MFGEALMSLCKTLTKELTSGLTGTTGRVIIGLNWTLVEGPRGFGLAHTPARGTAGCFGLSYAGELSGKSLAEIALGITSQNPFDRALAQASINAHWNRAELPGTDVNGLDIVSGRSGRTVVIGRFPGLAERIPDAKVIEREPGPNDYPTSAAPELLPGADQLLITASAFTDGSLWNYIALAPNAFTVLIGPGTPLSEKFFERGIDALAGFVIRDGEGAISAINQGGAVKALKKFGRNICLVKD